MDIDVIERRVREHHDFINEHRDTLLWLRDHMPFMEWLKERKVEWDAHVEGARHEADENTFGVDRSPTPEEHEQDDPIRANDPSKFPPPDSPETGDRPEGPLLSHGHVYPGVGETQSSTNVSPETDTSSGSTASAFEGTVSGHFVADDGEASVQHGGEASLMEITHVDAVEHDPAEPEHHHEG